MTAAVTARSPNIAMRTRETADREAPSDEKKDTLKAGVSSAGG